jgi:cytochrome c553
MSRIVRLLLAVGALGVCLIGLVAGQGRGNQPQVPPPPLLAWAFPQTQPGTQRPADDGTLKRVPGSDVTLTITQISDVFGPADWFPREHPAMPGIVAHGRREGGVWACALCHLPNALGHPESSGISGLSADYIVQDIRDWRSGARTALGGGGIMATFARAMTDGEVHEAAEYFASLKPARWTRVVEAETAPRTFVGLGNMRFLLEEGGTEPLGQRIVEVPEDNARAELRDSHSGFVAYVPPGSLKRGEALAAGGHAADGVITTGKTVQCAICHGPGLKGRGYVPALAGRSPIYIVRQLYFFQHGERNGPFAELMKDTVSRLNEQDMSDLAAYIGSLAP